MQVKLLPQDGEFYLFAESRDRGAKEPAMGRRQLKWLWKRLAHIAARKLTGEELLMRLGTARSHPRASVWSVAVPKSGSTFSYQLDRNKIRQARRREDRNLLRTNLAQNDPAQL